MSFPLFVILLVLTFVNADVPPMTDYVAYQSGQYGLRPNQTYYSSNITSPIFLVNAWNKDRMNNASHVALTYGPGPETGAGMLFSTTDLSLVWLAESSQEKVNGPAVQTYQGNDYLLIWLGRQTVGYGSGRWLVLNSSYDVVYTITAAGLSVGADFHECYLTDEGTALITAFNPIPFDLSGVGGTKNDTLIDCVFQEVDISTGRVLFTWHATAHFNITDSFAPYRKGPHGWDWCHISSVQKTDDGNYVVSFSLCSMIVHINGSNGNLIWVMGGRDNQFSYRDSGREPGFAYQNHAVFHDEGLKHLTLFDNHALNSSVGCTSNCSSARFLTVDYTTMSVSTVRQLSHPKSLRSGFMGSAQLLDGGNTLVDWGYNAAITEHAESGEVVWDIQFAVLAEAVGSYRAYKVNWKGFPITDPSIVVRRQNASSPEILYVSWNGATEVKRWILLASAAVNPLTRAIVVDAVPRAGFETAILVDSSARYIRAAGLDSQSEVLGMSAIWDRDSETTVNIRNNWTFQLI